MATKRSGKGNAKNDLEATTTGQPDPSTPLDWQLFLRSAWPVLKTLQDDLRARATSSAAVKEALVARHATERDNKRTADSFVEWRDHFIEQVAAAWLLSCVFVRTLEDRGLLGHNRLAGPGATDSLKLFLELAPSLNERDYLLTIFRELTRFAATRELFDARHNPVWLLTPSAEGAKALVHLFQQPRADVPAFRFGQSDTGFLGWLYQDLDAGVRERFALLQTPRFVESFILDRTLEPAITKFGLDDTTLIDPTCGSGHFLLGAFERLFDHQLRTSPGLSPREAAQKALNAVYGADINPYAVGIARFRLTLAFLDKAGFSNLATAPALPLHVVVGDSLLHNPHVSQPDFADLAPVSAGWRGDEFALEDEVAAKDVLHRKFAAVVGNPPYITVKDAVLRERYRGMYPRSAAGKYSVAAPFTERFFQLGRQGARIGMITASSFIQREFGKKLIEHYLPTVSLDLIINTSQAEIPGHKTPTVLLFGSAESPTAAHVVTVLASRGEPSTPDDPEQGLVWRSIADHWSEIGFENEFITVAPIERAMLGSHPWSLGGGGASELKELLEERAAQRLSELVETIGVGGMSNADDVFNAPMGTWRRQGMPSPHLRSFVIGEHLRDWVFSGETEVYFPYDRELALVQPIGRVEVLLWPFRTLLWARVVFGGGTYRTAGRSWWEWHQLTKDRYRTPLTIALAFVATHNHFVLDRGGKVFSRSAPIIKLPDTATEDDHLALLAYLNSSTACFWMKQVFYPKGTAGSDISTEKGMPEENRFEFASTGMASLPIPLLNPEIRSQLTALARHATDLAERRGGFSPRWFVGELAANSPKVTTVTALDEMRRQLLARLVVVQEEIDWLVYAAFDLAVATGSSIAFDAAEAPTRPFEWSGKTDANAPALWQQRHTILQSKDHKMLRVIEDPMYKRPWSGRRGVFGHAAGELIDQTRDAARTWVEEQAEAALRQQPTVATLIELSRAVPEAAAQRIVNAVGGADSLAFIRESLQDGESVPFLAALRFTDAGMDRYAEWEHAWDLQRREDAGEKIEKIPVPPKYGQPDYRSTTSWQLRGPLDVPKERFISYPGCESDQDGEPVYGWAGWDHEQRARALATLFVNRRDEESWPKERLTPMLAGLLELIPWLKQWHGTASDDYAGVSPGEYYEGFLDDECRKLGLTKDDLRAWRPAQKVRGAKKAPKAIAAPAAETDPDGNPVEGPAPAKKRGRPKKAASEGGEP
jgi:hypothetical protein